MTDLTEEELTQIFNEASDDFLIELIPKVIEDWLPAGKIQKVRKFHSDLLLIPGVKSRTALFEVVKKLGFIIESEVARKRNYIFRKHKLRGEWCFDIEQENLHYSDCSPTHHGLQCNHMGGTPEYQEIFDLCDQVVVMMKRIDELNGEKPDME